MGCRKLPDSFLNPTIKANKKKFKVRRNPLLKYEWTISKARPINAKKNR